MLAQELSEKAREKADINNNNKCEQTTWTKELAASQTRAELTDFERFKLMKANQARNQLIDVEFGRLRKAARETPAKPQKLKKKGKSRPAPKKKYRILHDSLVRH